MIFKNQYDARIRRFAPSGDPIKVQYVGQYDDHGNVVLMETGVVNTYEMIQSHKDSVDINVLIRRYVNGDTAALERAQGQYLDCTKLPKSYMEVLNTTIRAEADFMRLPVDVRAKFGHNFAQYISEIGSDEWAAKLGLKHAAAPDPASAPVSSSASESLKVGETK